VIRAFLSLLRGQRKSGDGDILHWPVICRCLFVIRPNIHHLLFAFCLQQVKSAIDKCVCPVLGLDNEIYIIHSGSDQNI